MKISRLLVFKSVSWTVVTYVLNQFIRVGTNVILARLLSPELFGIMVIVNSLRTGVDLLSDVGIGQNIIHNKNAEDPEFYDTAWTIQLVRGIVLWLLCSAAAYPLAVVYNAPILMAAIPATALTVVLVGSSSLSRFLMQRRMQFKRLNAFDVFMTVVGGVATVGLAYITPTIWALIFGAVAPSLAFAIVSHFLLPDVRHRFYYSEKYARQILNYGKWIFVSTGFFFFSANFDRLYLGKVAALEMLGVYGIARNLADMLTTLVIQVCNYAVFPLVATSATGSRDTLHAQIKRLRFAALLIAAVGVAVFAAISDVFVALLYDNRYQAAGWMLPILTLGVWLSSAVVGINESILLGVGKPSYAAAANGFKLCWFLIGLPIAYAHYGIAGAVAVAALSDGWRYFPIYLGQVKERIAFGLQDVLATIVVFALFFLFEYLRVTLGFDTPLRGFVQAAGFN